MLLAVWRLGENAYGATVRDELEARTSRGVAQGAVYVTLVRLEKKGLLRSRLSDPTPVRGGKAKRYFEILPEGIAGDPEAEVNRRVGDPLQDGLGRRGRPVSRGIDLVLDGPNRPLVAQRLADPRDGVGRHRPVRLAGRIHPDQELRHGRPWWPPG